MHDKMAFTYCYKSDKIMIPQILIIALGCIGLGMNIIKHGEPKKESKYNGWTHFIALVIYFVILAYGGFWRGLL